MVTIHFLLGADRDHFRSAVEDFEHSYLTDRKNRYPKTLHDAYNLLKGWKKGQSSYPQKVGVSFNTVGQEQGDVMVNQGSKPYDGPPCERCGHPTHPTSKCVAKKHANGTLLHVEAMGAVTLSKTMWIRLVLRTSMSHHLMMSMLSCSLTAKAGRRTRSHLLIGVRFLTLGF